MDLFSLILFCALSASPGTLTLTHQIATTVQGEPLYIDDLTAGVVYEPTTHAEASQIVTGLLEAGHDLRVGLTQLPARTAWLDYGLQPTQMLDACTNVAVGSDLLEQALVGGSTRHGLSRYLMGDPKDPVGLAWANYVLAQEVVEISDAAFELERPRPSRLYQVEQRGVFSTGPVKESRLGKRPSTRLFTKAPSSGAAPEPKKWDAQTVEQRESDVVPQSESLQNFAPTKTKRSTSRSNSSKAKRGKKAGKAQADVTTERLLTSDELKREVQ